MCCGLQGVQGISDIITIPGLVNVDFADVKSIMCNSGTAMLGVGVSTGKNRAEEAAMVSSSSATLTFFVDNSLETADATSLHSQILYYRHIALSYCDNKMCCTVPPIKQ